MGSIGAVVQAEGLAATIAGEGEKVELTALGHSAVLPQAKQVSGRCALQPCHGCAKDKSWASRFRATLSAKYEEEMKGCAMQMVE